MFNLIVISLANRKGFLTPFWEECSQRSIDQSEPVWMDHEFESARKRSYRQAERFDGCRGKYLR